MEGGSGDDEVKGRETDEHSGGEGGREDGRRMMIRRWDK